jgi:hypothetical protein
MPYVVFAQASEEKLPWWLSQNARRFFDASIDARGRDATRLDVGSWVASSGGRGRFDRPQP